MKIVILLLFPCALFAVDPVALDPELEVMEELIQATQKSLKFQKNLFLSLIAFKEARASFVEDPTSRKKASVLVKAAKCVQKELEQDHLTHLFSPDFLHEIQFFNQLGTEPRP